MGRMGGRPILLLAPALPFRHSTSHRECCTAQIPAPSTCSQTCCRGDPQSSTHSPKGIPSLIPSNPGCPQQSRPLPKTQDSHSNPDLSQQPRALPAIPELSQQSRLIPAIQNSPNNLEFSQKYRTSPAIPEPAQQSRILTTIQNSTSHPELPQQSRDCPSAQCQPGCSPALPLDGTGH